MYTGAAPWGVPLIKKKKKSWPRWSYPYPLLEFSGKKDVGRRKKKCRITPHPPPPPSETFSGLERHFSAGAAVARHFALPKHTPWRRPCMYIYKYTCDITSMITYRNTIRKQFVTLISTKSYCFHEAFCLKQLHFWWAWNSFETYWNGHVKKKKHLTAQANRLYDINIFIKKIYIDISLFHHMPRSNISLAAQNFNISHFHSLQKYSNQNPFSTNSWKSNQRIKIKIYSYIFYSCPIYDNFMVMSWMLLHSSTTVALADPAPPANWHLSYYMYCFLFLCIWKWLWPHPNGHGRKSGGGGGGAGDMPPPPPPLIEMRNLFTWFLTLWAFFFCLSERFVMYDGYPYSVSWKLSKKCRVWKKSVGVPPPPPHSFFWTCATLEAGGGRGKKQCGPPPPMIRFGFAPVPKAPTPANF